MDRDFIRINAQNLSMLWETLLLNGKIDICTEKLKDCNLVDVKILKLLTNESNITIKMIGQKLNVPSSTLTSAIKRLEKRELIKRKISKRDLRSYDLEVTAEGVEAIRDHRKAEQAIFENMLKVFNTDEVNNFLKLFEKLVRAIEQ